MSGATTPGSENFTGRVQARLLRSPDAESALGMFEVTFAAAARTHWHTHPRGQGLFITAGRARVQIEGQPVADHATGDFIWIPPGARHWHGAGPDGPMTHIAAQEAAPDGNAITWCEAVTDATYAARDDEEHP